jgi:hypothetical protein
MEKSGFVYIWRDRKHNRYYIGCHWGTEGDGYICSSSWMAKAYKRRPQDFKRRILSRGIQDKQDLLDEEYKWLQKIKPEEIKFRYYNLRIHHYGHWTNNIDARTIREKISDSTKAAMQRPEVREKYLTGMQIRDNRSADLEVRKKRSKSMLALNGTDKGEQRKKKISRSSKEMWNQEGFKEEYSKVKKESWKRRVAKGDESVEKQISCLGLNDSSEQSRKSKLRWADPEKRAKAIQKSKDMWKDPEYRKRRLESYNRTIANRK